MWKTVRVFVSSTFIDMQAEREYLAKVVFPELRDRMTERNLHLVDLDLRWGVTQEQAERGKVLEECLKTIDRSRPFFVGLLGERYGSLPDRIPEETQRAFPWLQDYDGYSLTSLEIVHGVLRNPEIERHSFFYFRDPEFINLIPESRRADFIARDPEESRKLSTLKDKIRAAGVPITENYYAYWDEQNEKAAGLEAFGQKVLEDLWTAICEEYPAEASEGDPVAQAIASERQMHEAFAEEHSYMHAGRVEQATRLTNHVQGENPRPVVISGEPGCGKSAFLANWYRQYATEHPDSFVLAYFVGASPDSTSHIRLLRNMCKELRQKFMLEQKVPQEDMKLSEVFAQMLTSITTTESFLCTCQQPAGELTKRTRVKRVIILLDALDQLLPLEAAHGLGWLLDNVPCDARLVVSSLEGDCLDVLRRRGAEEIRLPQLSYAEQNQIINSLLETWEKKLDSKQTTALLAHSETKNPLYLRVALEELRLFGKFEYLTKRIVELSPNILGLFSQVLERLEEDYGREFVAKTFSLLSCSRYGLSEVELIDLLSTEKPGRLPRAYWTHLMFGAKMYLVQKGELFSFFHRQFEEAVKTRYHSESQVHKELAKYFMLSPIERKIDEFPFQLQRSEQWQRLAAALSDLYSFNYVMKDNRKYEWIQYWNSLKNCFAADHYYGLALDAKLRNEGESQDLASLYDSVGSFLEDIGLSEASRRFNERALKIRENNLGSTNLFLATSLNNRGALYFSQGKYAEAFPLYEKALQIHEVIQGPNHPDLAPVLNNMALVYSAQGKYHDALMLLDRALKISRNASAPDDLAIATTLNDISLVYNSQGRYAEAFPILQQALKIFESTLSPNDPRIGIILYNMAELQRIQRKYSEALPLYERAVKICELTGALGPNHLQIQSVRERLKICQSILGISPAVATNLNDRALLYHKQGKYGDALPLYERAVKMSESILGLNHLNVSLSLTNLAKLYCDRGEYEKALPLYQRALNIRETKLGANHIDVAVVVNHLALLYRFQGRFSEALQLYKRALKITESTLGSNHIEVAKILNNIAGLYNAQGKFREALQLFQQTLPNILKTRLSDGWFVATTLNNMAALHRNLGEYAEAIQLYQLAIQVYEENLGPNHPELAFSLNGLADSYRAQGSFAEASKLYERALKIREKSLNPDHPLIKLVKENLVKCRNNQK